MASIDLDEEYENKINIINKYTKFETEKKEETKTKSGVVNYITERIEYKDYVHPFGNNELTWYDFLENVRKTFLNKRMANEYVEQNLPLVCRKVLSTDTYFIKITNKRGESLVERKTLPDDFLVRWETEENRRFFTLLTFIKNHPRPVMRNFSSTTFMIRGDVGKNLNKFMGFKANYLYNTPSNPVNPPEEIKLILSHIKDVMCGGDEIVNKYFLSWVRNVFVGVKNITAPIFISDQGAGKSSLIDDFIRPKILGKLGDTINGFSNLLGGFNGIIEDKLLISVNEVHSDGSSRRDIFNSLKSLITDSSVVINRKGVNQYSIDNTASFIFFSNHADSIDIEDSDRRYCPIQSSESKIGDTGYFNSLRKSFNDKNADLFFTYIINLPNNELLDTSDVVQTSFKNMIKESNRDMIYNFVRDVRMGTINIFKKGTMEVYSKTDLFNIKCQDLYGGYTQWAQEGGFKYSKSIQKFASSLKTELKLESWRSNFVYFNVYSGKIIK